MRDSSFSLVAAVVEAIRDPRRNWLANRAKPVKLFSRKKKKDLCLGMENKNGSKE